MTVEKRTLKDGKTAYTVRVSVPNPDGKGSRRYTVGSYRTRKLAESAERKAKDSIAAGTFTTSPPEPPKVTTIRDIVTSWLIGKRATVTPNTHAQYQAVADLHLFPAIGDRDVSTLTRSDVRDLVREWQTRERFGPQLQHRCMLVLRGALDEAVDDGLIAFNPSDRVKLPSPKKRRDVRQWTPEQLRTFLEHADRDRLAPLWYLLVLEGMRRGEALGLRWRDVTFTGEGNGVATILQTVTALQGSGGKVAIQDRAKTRGSQRTVQLTGATVAALKAHRDRQTFAGTPNPHDLVFTNAVGGPIDPNAVDTYRDIVLTAAGLKGEGLPAVTTHDLRHMAATMMLRAGVSPAIVAAKLGHADASITTSVYGHLTTSDQQAATDAVESFLERGRKVGG